MTRRPSLTGLFPLFAIGAAAIAYYWPAPLAALSGAIVPLLSLVMFGMGLTLTPANFREVGQRPWIVVLGVVLQFALMPLLGWGLGTVLSLAPPLLVGLVLVGSSPGGTASNVICYLARGDVALSITLTTCSTLLAVLVTPLLTWFYIGERVPVPVLAMFISVGKIVLLPVLVGVLANHFLHRRIAPLKHVFPVLSIVAIVVIIAIVVALNQEQLADLATVLVVAVMLHNALGLALGYLIPRTLGCSARDARTLAIEVGMQNSGLAVALATQFFSASAALPGALFSVWHNVSGAVVAARWSRRPPVR